MLFALSFAWLLEEDQANSLEHCYVLFLPFSVLFVWLLSDHGPEPSPLALPKVLIYPSNGAYIVFFPAILSFSFSRSSFLSALFRIPSCMPRLNLITNWLMLPIMLKPHAIMPWVQYGALVYAYPWAPPARPTFARTAATNPRGLGTRALGFRILDIALVTR